MNTERVKDVFAIPPDMTDIDLRKIVQRDNDERLRKELKAGQTVLDSSTIDKLLREDLISQVTLLRRAAGQTSAVQSVVAGFKPATFSLLESPTASLPTPSPSVSSDSMTALLTMLMQQSQQRDERMQQQIMQQQQQQQQQFKQQQQQMEQDRKERQQKEENERKEREQKEERLAAERLEEKAAEKQRIAEEREQQQQKEERLAAER